MVPILSQAQEHLLEAAGAPHLEEGALMGRWTQGTKVAKGYGC